MKSHMGTLDSIMSESGRAFGPDLVRHIARLRQTRCRKLFEGASASAGINPTGFSGAAFAPSAHRTGPDLDAMLVCYIRDGELLSATLPRRSSRLSDQGASRAGSAAAGFGFPFGQDLTPKLIGLTNHGVDGLEIKEGHISGREEPRCPGLPVFAIAPEL